MAFPFLAAIPVVGKIINSVIDLIPNENDRAKAREKLEQDFQSSEFQIAVAQIAVNQQEAAHKSIFVAGWRPALGWIGVIGLGYNYIFGPLLNLILENISANTDFLFVPFETLDLGPLIPLVMALVGMVGARSYEKMKGVARPK